jgi:hypothetical protein
MKLTHFAAAAMLALFSITANAAAFQLQHELAMHDPSPAADDSKAAATRVMNVLLADGLVAGEDSAKLRDALSTIFAKGPTATGDATKDAAAQKKVKDQVQAAVLRQVGKDKSARVSELLAKPEAWEAKACAKGKACCAGHK